MSDATTRRLQPRRRARTFRFAAVVSTLACAAVVWAAPATVSKSYVLKPNVELGIGVDFGDGLRLDSVEFVVPAPDAERVTRTAGSVRANVAISNGGEGARRVGIAVAVFDDDGRLVGVASGGSRVLPMRSDRQTVYTVVFDDVNRAIRKASKFQITVEQR